MRINEIKQFLSTAPSVNFQLPDGTYVPEHFHVTEIGIVTKHFIDCGGKEKIEKVANFQLWNANDYEHRLKPNKLNAIIALAESRLGMGNLEIEVEYQQDTIGKYGLHYNGEDFVLISKQTACLAQDACDITPTMKVVYTQEPAINTANNSCTPGGGCC